MIDTQASGAYSKTSAYNFLKNLLGIPKGRTINKKFFSLFFQESEGFYFIKKSEDLVLTIFTNQGIKELNKVYFEKKLNKDDAGAKKIAEQVIDIVKESMTT